MNCCRTFFHDGLYPPQSRCPVASNFRSFRQSSLIGRIRRSFTTLSHRWGRNQHLGASDPRDSFQSLGVNGAEETNRHPSFPQHINFKRLLRKSIQPAFGSNVSGSLDVSSFDAIFSGGAAGWYGRGEPIKLDHTGSVRRFVFPFLPFWLCRDTHVDCY